VSALSVATSEQRRTVSIAVDPALLARLDQAARHVGVSRSDMLHYVLLHGLDAEKLEDVCLAIVADRALTDPDNQELIPWEQVKAESHADRRQ